MHQTNFKLNTSWQIFTFFNADQPPVEQVINKIIKPYITW